MPTIPTSAPIETTVGTPPRCGGGRAAHQSGGLQARLDSLRSGCAQGTAVVAAPNGLGASNASVPSLARMQVTDLAEVVGIEEVVHSHPWSHGNFLDSLGSGHDAWVLRDACGLLLGYVVLMPVVDEMHVLTISVRAEAQGQGIGRMLMKEAALMARAQGMASMLLEVRPSNQPALRVYGKLGYQEIGRRKGYYAAAGQGREDALVLRLALADDGGQA